MQHIDIQVLEAVVGAVRAGQTSWLCTVLATYGSSPRPVDAMMHLANGAGGLTMTGSVSGGCVEQVLVEQIESSVFLEASSVALYGGGDDPRIQLPCGGQLKVVIECLEPLASNLTLFTGLLEQIKHGRQVTREISLPDGAVHLQRLGPAQQIVMIGRSLVAEQVAQLARFMGYRVVLIDPRQAELDSWPVAGVELFCGLADDWLATQADHAHCAILALTHDPRIDDMGMLAAFDTNAFYVGAMGSARTSRARRERYLSLGISEQQLARLKAPIGLPIGSKTPAEIAVAIIADIVATYRLAA